MPAKKKMPKEQKKVKLRTASDVLSRLKWSSDEEELNPHNTIVGYDCRIKGPMEKSVKDFDGIDKGGDIPEHRIQYFRRRGDGEDNDNDAPFSEEYYEKLIFWDRVGRVDRLFGSGNPKGPISPITLQNVTKAVAYAKLVASASNSPTGALPADYLVIVDFEATCEDSKNRNNPPQKLREIIEFPAVLLNVRTREVEDEFHHYILPDVHPKLSEFCTELTGITQETVDQQGISLKDAIRLHQEWILQHNLTNNNDDDDDAMNHQEEEERPQHQFLYVTCGDWDFKTGLPSQLAYHNQKVPELFSRWVNIKKPYKMLYGRKVRGGMASMLEELDIPLEGHHHSGIDDSRNIARICARMLEDGWQP